MKTGSMGHQWQQLFELLGSSAGRLGEHQQATAAMTARVLCTAHLVPTGVQEAAGRVWDDAGAHHHVHGVDSRP